MNKQTIINDDCLKVMKGMDSESIDIVITSCPYNIGVKYNSYDDNKTQPEYLDWMYEVSEEIKRLFFLQNHIVWVKSIDINDNSFGHFKPINSGRFLNNNHESIFHFTKTGEVKIDRLAVGSKYKDKSN